MLITTPESITLEQLAAFIALDAEATKVNRLYLHWTAGRYTQVFDDYHINIGQQGEIYLTCKSLAELKAHTWHRNTYAVGITLDCGLGAMCWQAELDEATGIQLPPHIIFGPYPPTQAQIETLAQVIAVITKEVGLPIDEGHVLTHAEAAQLDGYGPGSGDPETRWDLWYLPDLPVTPQLVSGGQVLRGKALWYLNQLY